MIAICTLFLIGLALLLGVLAADTPRTFHEGDLADYPMTANTTIYEGAFVGVDPATGYAKGLVSTNDFVGVCTRRVVCGAVAGSTRVVVRSGIFRITCAVTGASAVTDVDKPVYASADDTLTLTQSTNVAVGRIIEWISGTTCVVELRSCRKALATIAAPAGGATIDAEARTAINSIRTALMALGIVRTA